MFVEDVGLFIALGHGADFAGRHLLEGWPRCGSSSLNAAKQPRVFKSDNLERTSALFVHESEHQIRPPAEVHVHPVDDRPVCMPEGGSTLSFEQVPPDGRTVIRFVRLPPTIRSPLTLHPSAQQSCIRKCAQVHQSVPPRRFTRRWFLL